MLFSCFLEQWETLWVKFTVWLGLQFRQGAEGTGLAFIVFTQAIVEFGPSAPFWSIVFFLMLLSLGLGSEFGTIEGVATSLYDLDFHPWVRKKWLVAGEA